MKKGKIMMETRMNKKELLELLASLKIDKEEFWILSSSSLVLRDLFESAGDLDIAVTQKGLNQLKESYNLVLKENGFYNVADKVECVLKDDKPNDLEQCEGYNLQNLNTYFAYLTSSKRPKDKIRYDIVKKELERSNQNN